MKQFQKISIENILTGTRFRKDCGSVQSLANSISKLGLLQPIVVQPADDGKFLLLAGFRRIAACKLLKLHMIEAHVVGVDGND